MAQGPKFWARFVPRQGCSSFETSTQLSSLKIEEEVYYFYCCVEVDYPKEVVGSIIHLFCSNFFTSDVGPSHPESQLTEVCGAELKFRDTVDSKITILRLTKSYVKLVSQIFPAPFFLPRMRVLLLMYKWF